MPNYKLLTPGPLTTTDTVKKEMMFDHCTWDDDYKQITQKIRKKLLKLAHVSEKEYTAVLMQGSGTFGVESVIGSSVGDSDKILVCANGAYGERMAENSPGRWKECDSLPGELRPDSGRREGRGDSEGGSGNHPCGHDPQRNHLRDPE